MPTRMTFGASLLALLALTSPGCSWGPTSRISSLEAENARLVEQSRAQLAELANLKEHARQVEDKLLDAESNLAALTEQNGVGRRKLANLQGERERILAGTAIPAASRLPAGYQGQLEDLARRYPDLFHFDSATGISKLDTDVLFDSGEAELKTRAEDLLQELAQILQAPEAADLNVMVVGHTDSQPFRAPAHRQQFRNNWHLSSARALAVADRLRDLGVAPGRIGVAGFGPQQPIASNDSEQTRQYNRRVEVFLVAPDVPIVGMTETLTNLY